MFLGSECVLNGGGNKYNNIDILLIKISFVCFRSWNKIPWLLVVLITMLMDFEVVLLTNQNCHSGHYYKEQSLYAHFWRRRKPKKKKRYLGRAWFITKPPSNPIIFFGLAANYWVLATTNWICGTGFQRALIPIILSVLDIACEDSLKCAKQQGI